MNNNEDFHTVDLGNGDTLELPSHYSNAQVNDAVQTHMRQQALERQDPSLKELGSLFGNGYPALVTSLNKSPKDIAKNTAMGIGGGLTRLYQDAHQTYLNKEKEQNTSLYKPGQAEQYAEQIANQRNAAERLPSSTDYLAQELQGGIQHAPQYAAIGGVARGMGPLAEALQPSLERLPQALRNAGNAISRPFSPVRQSRELADVLGGGARNPAEANFLTANEIHGAHQNRMNEGGDIFEHVKGQLGEKNIFNGQYPTYEFFDKELGLQNEEGRIGELYKRFKENSTLNNSHALSSAVGKDAEGLDLSDPANRRRREMLNRVYDKVTGYHESYLENHYPEALEDWRSGQGYYTRHVDPYRKEMKDVIWGDVTNPGAEFHQRFQNPQFRRDANGQLIPGNVEKILTDLSPQAVNRVLYSATQGHGLANRPRQYLEELSRAIGGGQGGGYERFAPHDLNERMQGIRSALRNRNIAAGVGIGALSYLGKNKIVDLLRDLLVRHNPVE